VIGDFVTSNSAVEEFLNLLGSTSLVYVLRNKSLHGVEGVSCVGETLCREMRFEPLQKIVAFSFCCKLDCDAVFVIRRLRGRGAKTAAA
jgi:hypothetical protein